MSRHSGKMNPPRQRLPLAARGNSIGSGRAEGKRSKYRASKVGAGHSPTPTPTPTPRGGVTVSLHDAVPACQNPFTCPPFVLVRGPQTEPTRVAAWGRAWTRIGGGPGRGGQPMHLAARLPTPPSQGRVFLWIGSWRRHREETWVNEKLHAVPGRVTFL